MQPKKRIDLIVEEPILPKVLDILDRHNVSGYTVFPALAGKGRGGRWSREGLVGTADQMLNIVCVTSEERIEPILNDLYKLVARQIGIITVSDVAVIRGEHFQ